MEESLLQFLQEEELSGSNQYHCSRCSKLSDASRKVLLHALPPHLIVQLKRFVFDEKAHLCCALAPLSVSHVESLFHFSICGPDDRVARGKRWREAMATRCCTLH